MLVVEGEAERGAAGCTSQNGVVAVAARERRLRELGEPARGRPVAPRVEARGLEKDIELRLVLDRALDPAELVLQLLRSLWDQLGRDLHRSEAFGQCPVGWIEQYIRDSYLAGLYGEFCTRDDGREDGDDRHGL